jgi:hypothetical protein
MAIDFGSLLSNDQKREILEARIASFANEGYQHELNKATAASLGNEEGVTSADEAIATLSAAISAHQTELSALPAAE